MGEFSISHILVLGVLALIFFGPNKLPQFGQSLGKAIRGFKQGLNEIDVDAKDVTDQARPSQQINNQTGQSMNAQGQTQDVKNTDNKA